MSKTPRFLRIGKRNRRILANGRTQTKKAAYLHLIDQEITRLAAEAQNTKSKLDAGKLNDA